MKLFDINLEKFIVIALFTMICIHPFFIALNPIGAFVSMYVFTAVLSMLFGVFSNDDNKKVLPIGLTFLYTIISLFYVSYNIVFTIITLVLLSFAFVLQVKSVMDKYVKYIVVLAFGVAFMSSTWQHILFIFALSHIGLLIGNLINNKVRKTIPTMN